MFVGAGRYIRDLSIKWSAKRRPKGKAIVLDQRSIFIFPTLAGWMYLLSCIVLFLVATNYQNNLIHAVAFLLIALGIITIHFTFLNLSGVKIAALKGHNTFVGDMAEFSLLIESSSQRGYDNIQLGWTGGIKQSIYIDSDEKKQIGLYAVAQTRGRFYPGILKLETHYPLGLLRAWSWVELDITSIVYPKPIKGRHPDQSIEIGDSELGRDSGGDDFIGLEAYQPGASIRHIAWKPYAQGRGLFVKKFGGQSSRQLWLDWQDWPELASEGRLSVMCYWAQRFEHNNIEYGLNLPTLKIPPNSGPEHLERVLIALALFQGE